MAEEFAVQTPAATGNKKQEVQQMNLQQLLAANPEAKAEFDTAINSATAAGQKAGSDAMASTIKQVSPFLTSTEYPEIIKTTALAVLTGEGQMSTLTAAVAAVDAVKQMNATAAATAATTATGESTGQQVTNPATPAAKSDLTSTDADLESAVAAMKEV